MQLTLRSPMLALGEVPNIKKLHYPMWSSIKMDGIRCLILDGQLTSRSGKKIPNRNVTKFLSPLVNYCQKEQIILDGELWSPNHTFSEIMSCVMSQSNACLDGLNLYAFDCLTYDEWQNKTSEAYNIRFSRLFHATVNGPKFFAVEQTMVGSAVSLQSEYEARLLQGHEGLIVRSPTGKYKWGRTTFREMNMFKLKAVNEIDVEVIGHECLYNIAPGTEREYDEFGRPKAVHRNADRIPTESLGTLLVRDEQGREFRVGSGFTQAVRNDLWRERATLVGRWCKIKYAVAGEKDLPRHPVFITWRDPK